jgi:uncharacterized protein with ParB-like and HNH nuclease domain
MNNKNTYGIDFFNLDHVKFRLGSITSPDSLAEFMLTSRFVLDTDVWLEKYGRNLQRPYVWSIKQKSQLILSVIQDKPIPHLTFYLPPVHNREYPTFYKVLDGKQRLGALFGYVRGEFPILYKDKSIYFSELDRVLTCKVLNYTPSYQEYRGYLTSHHSGIFDHLTREEVIELTDRPISDDDLLWLFDYLNHQGTPH